ncbi:hypothetical protein G9464_20900 [Halostella sp. JP-L12]|uniref:hypothetical protein n=1 Tax=Halostella TaxID=1843185 RepID=UPI0013CEFE59|nr:MULTISPECIES: hypothetical protein [Halostella]NHN50031.1 hypothetical protein [Halostella sp. JP-L12]
MASDWVLFPAAVLLSMVGGYWLFTRRSAEVGFLDGIWRALMAFLWFIGALITIAQGFYAIGMVMGAIFFSFVLKNSSHARENYEGQGSSVRRRVGGWDPWWVRD